MGIYLLSFMACHMSTCAALASVLLFRAINGMHPEDATAWVDKWGWFLKVPVVKAVMGMACYLSSVMLISWRDLVNNDTIKAVAFTIGIMTISSIVMTVGFITLTTESKLNYYKSKVD